ncbi:MAG: hypothetical protein AB8B50_04070 [Pirellulaceae bacterium]
MWKIFCAMLSLVLLAASFMKYLDMRELVTQSGLLGDPRVLTMAIAFEVLVAVLILLLTPAFARMCIIVFFSLLTCTSGYALVTGLACNCFGIYGRVDLMFSFDLIVLCIALSWRPASKPYTKSSAKPLLISLACFGVALLACNAKLNALERNSQFALDPRFLESKPWPVGQEINAELGALEEGEWYIILLRDGCSRCNAVQGKVNEMLLSSHSDRRLATFNMAKGKWNFSLHSSTLGLLESGSVAWGLSEPFTVSPTVILVNDGLVTGGALGEESIRFIDDRIKESLGGTGM